MLVIASWIRLVRLDSSLLGFSAVFAPCLFRSHDLNLSFVHAIPILFICFATFIANDIDDLESDRINHADRPLPKGRISLTAAAVAFYLMLFSALFLIRGYIPANRAFWYYGLCAVSISYGYIVGYLPSLKAPFVAIIASIPIVIVALVFEERNLYLAAVAMFAITMGREFLMDLLDRSGDPDSVIGRIDPGIVSLFGFGSVGAGAALLAFQLEGLLDYLVFTITVAIMVSTAVLWYVFDMRRVAILSMKSIYLVGLYFLT